MQKKKSFSVCSLRNTPPRDVFARANVNRSGNKTESSGQSRPLRHEENYSTINWKKPARNSSFQEIRKLKIASKITDTGVCAPADDPKTVKSVILKYKKVCVLFSSKSNLHVCVFQ